jgi:hypothetical protein
VIIKSKRRVFYDTEFVEDGRTIGLLSIGAVDEDGREFYAVNQNSQVMTHAVQRAWLRDNVIPYLPVNLVSPEGAAGLISPPSWKWSWDTAHPDYGRVMPHRQIARELLEFLDPRGREPELWAWFGAYDHVTYAQLWGPMVELPPGLPMVTHELVQRWEDAGCPPKPAQESGLHNALGDARWNRQLWQACEEARRA